MQKGISVPESLEGLLVRRALGDKAAEKAAGGRLSKKELAEITAAMLELSDRFNGIDATPLGEYMASRWHRAAYFLYFLPANFAKAQAVLWELAPTLSGKTTLSVLDAGSGPGSLSLGLLDFVARQTDIRELKILALDSSREALEDWRFLVRGYAGVLAEEGKALKASYVTRTVDLAAAEAAEGEYDVVLFGDSLNELFAGSDEGVKERAALLADYAGRLTSGGSIVVIEPALKELSRQVQAIRDLLVRDYGMSIYAPCLRQGPCPMLAAGRERDWCHTAVLWMRPRIVRQIDEIAKRNKHVVKFSYLVARRTNGCPVEIPEGAQTLRVVGDRMAEKGKFHALLCGEGGCEKYTLLRRDEVPAREDFTRMHRGDIVSVLKGGERGDGIRLDAESAIRLLKKFS